MLIKMTKTAPVSGTEWKKGTVLEATRKDAEQAIKDKVAELVPVEAKTPKADATELESLRSELEETKNQLEEANAFIEELSKGSKKN